MRNAFLAGRSIYLRPVEPEDAPHYQTSMNDEEVVRNLLVHRPLTREDQRRFNERAGAAAEPTEPVFAIVRTRGDLLLGATGLHAIDWRRRLAGFGIQIGRKGEWGKGYGTEATSLMLDYAFRDLNLNKVWLQVYEYNTRGIGAYTRVGFRVEATFREDRFTDGRYWDTFHMGILRREWERRKRGGTAGARAGRRAR